MEKFIVDLTDALDCVATLNADTTLANLDEWDSLGKLSTISMILDDYSVSIEGDELKAVSTVADLFALINSKKA